MKIQILSDLHLEFEGHHYLDCDCDVVVLAGDIHTKGLGVKWALEHIKDKPVIYVLGNYVLVFKKRWTGRVPLNYRHIRNYWSPLYYL